MGLGTYSFVSGFTKSVKDGIDKREENENERKKSIFLEELRRDTYKWQKDLDESYSARLPDKDQTQIDYKAGEKILRNSGGKEIGRIKLTASDMEAYDMDRRASLADLTKKEVGARYAEQEAQSGLARDRAAINASNASAASSRASAAATRRGLALDGSGSTSNGASDVAREMKYQYKDTVANAMSAKVPGEEIDRAALAVVQQAKREGWSRVKAEEIFLDSLRRLRRHYGAAAEE